MKNKIMRKRVAMRFIRFLPAMKSIAVLTEIVIVLFQKPKAVRNADGEMIWTAPDVIIDVYMLFQSDD